MRYQRQESLRYTFKTPPPTEFTIIQIKDYPVQTSHGSGTILNLSPNGLLLFTKLKMPFNKHVRLLLQTAFFQQTTEWKAEVVWGKQAGAYYHYGLALLDDHHQEIINLLKQHKPQEPNS
ncbi:PilZ domain-containing protein [Halobacillus sp. A5]|uniref:PilZ domain-containing protein n=1 Tax=Halobacillus sp. A5 TaxID=2880263 RepID=UPI0020A64C27|nr:PilZ domain-containing protein [Halobacillus sp. A5]MCP3029042.1 PilZ domain-containing protein [Halobacillus sp. A5]